MEEEINANYMCYATTKDLWDNINQMYSNLGNQSQAYELTLKLGDIRQGGDNVTKYFNSLKILWQELDLLTITNRNPLMTATTTRRWWKIIKFSSSGLDSTSILIDNLFLLLMKCFFFF